jgi:hypothetical protein
MSNGLHRGRKPHSKLTASSTTLKSIPMQDTPS